MKIALMTPFGFDLPGGINTHVIRLADEFAKAGHDVSLLAPWSKGKPERDGHPVFPLGRAFPVRAAGSVAYISFSVWKYRGIRAYLRREKIDILHVHEPLTPFMAWLVVWGSPAVTVATFHSFAEGRARRLQIFKPLLDTIMRRLNARIAVSRAALDFISRYYPGDYTVIPNGVDFDHFAAQRPRLDEFDDDRINILFVGRAEERKGVDYLLRAYARLKRRSMDVRLTIVGPGHPDASALRLIAECDLDDVVFTGAVSDDYLPRYYHSADIFCWPAVGQESFGMVLLEAMAAGLPIVASEIAGFSAVLRHGKNGLSVPPKDTEALADALETLISDPVKRRVLGSAGKALAERYRWSNVAQEVMDVYRWASPNSRR